MVLRLARMQCVEGNRNWRVKKMGNLLRVEAKTKAACPTCNYQGMASDFRVKRNHRYASIYDSYEYICPMCNEALSIKGARKQIALSVLMLAVVIILFVYNEKLGVIIGLVAGGALLIFAKSNSQLEFLKRQRY